MSSLRESVDERGRVVSLGVACVADPGGWGSWVDAEHLLEDACRELDSWEHEGGVATFSC